MKITQFFVRQNKDDEKSSCLSDCFEIFVIQSGWFLYMILLYIYKKNLKDSQILSIFFILRTKRLRVQDFRKLANCTPARVQSVRLRENSRAVIARAWPNTRYRPSLVMSHYLFAAGTFW